MLLRGPQEPFRMGNMHHSAETQEIPKEVLILGEIKESEKKAEEIIEIAKKQKESIIQEAKSSASKMIASSESEARKSHEKKLMDFKDRSKLLFEEKISEHKISAKQAKTKADKNIPRAADIVIKKFEEMIL